MPSLAETHGGSPQFSLEIVHWVHTWALGGVVELQNGVREVAAQQGKAEADWLIATNILDKIYN